MPREETHFTREEAVQLIGKRFRNTAPYANVPAGTVGRVVDLYPVGGQRFGVDIQWDRPAPLRELRDGFSKQDLEMIFTGGAEKGKRAMIPLDEVTA